MSIADLVARTGLLGAATSSRRPAARAWSLLRQPQPWLVDRAWFRGGAAARWSKPCASFTARIRCSPGIARQDLRGRELAGAPPFRARCAAGRGQEILRRRAKRCGRAAHKLVLKQDEEQARAAIERAFEQAGLAAPAVAEVLAKSGVEPARARSLLADPAARKTPGARSATTWCFTSPPSTICGDCWPLASRRASTWAISRIGPASRASTPSRCWNSWTASTSRAAKATNGLCCEFARRDRPKTRNRERAPPHLPVRRSDHAQVLDARR